MILESLLSQFQLKLVKKHLKNQIPGKIFEFEKSRKKVLMFEIIQIILIMLSQLMEQQVQNNSGQIKKTHCQTHSFGYSYKQPNISQNISMKAAETAIQLLEGCQKSSQINKFDFQNLFQAIGVIQSTWVDEDGKPLSVSFGTAFAVAPKIIMTCTHNIYSEQHSAFSSEITFYPNIRKGSLQTQVGFKSQKNKFYYCFKPKCSLSNVPQKQEICFIILKDQLKIKNFIQIGQLGSQFTPMSQALNIVGYPSDKYKLSNLQVCRKQSCGKIHSRKNNTINHTIYTESGQSGSPILHQDNQGKWKAIGIHTHLGFSSEFNSGVQFNEQTFKIIQLLLKQIRQSYNTEVKISRKVQLSQQDQVKTEINQLMLQSQLKNLNESVPEQLNASLDSLNNSEMYIDDVQNINYQHQSLMKQQSLTLIRKEVKQPQNFLKIYSQQSEQDIIDPKQQQNFTINFLHQVSDLKENTPKEKYQGYFQKQLKQQKKDNGQNSEDFSNVNSQFY